MFCYCFVFCLSFLCFFFFFFFFNDTATTEIYTLSLHDALPICCRPILGFSEPFNNAMTCNRSEEHTSELQSHSDLVCRLLLEKKKKKKYYSINIKKKIKAHNKAHTDKTI